MASSTSSTLSKTGYSLVDIGANLTHPKFANKLPRVLESAAEAGVSRLILTGTSLEVTAKSRDLARRFTDTHGVKLYWTAGVHPHDAKTFTGASCLDRLRELAQQADCVAIGECGLDFNRNFSTPEDQIKAFEAQVTLACELQLPLFLHEREASDALLEVLLSEKHRNRALLLLPHHLPSLPPVVIHCFTGTASEMQTYLDKGFYIGLTGFLWKDKLPDGVQYALRAGRVPLDRLLLETDAPFMFPNVKHKKMPKAVTDRLTPTSLELLKSNCNFDRNEPCSLAAICEMIAAFMSADISDSDDVITAVALAERTSQNAERVFFTNRK